MLDGYRHTPEDGTREEQLHHLILFMLDHVDHISDMCRIFREIWALSTRNEGIHSQLVRYYEVTLNKLTELLIPLADNREAAVTMACLLMPYFEGYSITFMALPEDKSETAQEVSTSILDPIYRAAEFMAFPWFYWVAFMLMVTGVVAFALQLVFTKFLLMFR